MALELLVVHAFERRLRRALDLAEVLAAQNAQEAADMLLGRCQIAVVDSQSVSVGLGSLVEAARLRLVLTPSG